MKTLRMLLLSSLACWSMLVHSLNLPEGIRQHPIGQAPDFTIQDMDGIPFRLSSARGQWVFLHFWASWCGPCQEEMPEIAGLMALIPDSQLRYVLVNTAEDEDTVFGFLGAFPMALETLLDSDGLVTEMYKPRGLPTTILIDPDGQVRYQAIGGREWTRPDYVRFLRELLAAGTSP